MKPDIRTSDDRGQAGGIAIVGWACRYPDASSPLELWENVLAQRRAFRRMPEERMRWDDYYSPDRAAPDRTYSLEAALIEGFEFDRLKYKVMGSTFRSADWSHWLALDVASRALTDAGYPEGSGLPLETTGVALGNTLTGEFSRANVMRLRWPYVRRVLEAALIHEQWDMARRQRFITSLEEGYKSPFPPVAEETLAGGLSNTIAGRICNHFNLNGGGYTIDGACASSLLAVANACTLLTSGDLDVALAGGVDLSLDPFELVGFAKTGALAAEEMRVYDTRSAGFWPGEGCGVLVLMRLADALAEARRIYGVIRGWGISSDGAGGMTRPEEHGQLHALRRAYRRAGFGIDTVGYFEGHGTGTQVGDDIEVRALIRASREAGTRPTPAYLGSVKANIGHTKAAAGIAGLIKAAMALHTQIIPPTCGCEIPHPELASPSATLRPAREAMPWPEGAPLRAGVSAMGFGGINSHVVLEGVAASRRRRLSPRERQLSCSPQDVELFVFGAKDAAQLLTLLNPLLDLAPRLSRGELGDLSAELAKRSDRSATRAAVVAATPRELAARLGTLQGWLREGREAGWDAAGGLFLGQGDSIPRIGFLFPGQGSPAPLSGGIHARRFSWARECYESVDLPQNLDRSATQVAQPALCLSSLVGLKLMANAGIQAEVGLGHSLGELSALHWAGVFDEAALLRIASLRGRAMAELGSPTGAMAAIAAPAQEVKLFLTSQGVSIVGLNSPRQTVISGDSASVDRVIARARAGGRQATRLSVSHAFHTLLVAAATRELEKGLRQELFARLARRVVSTVEGSWIGEQEDLRALLCRQVTAPVRFIEALGVAAPQVDLWIEVGAGEVLSGLLGDFSDMAPVVPLDVGGSSLRGWVNALGAAFARGASVNLAAIADGRFTKPFALDWTPRFFGSPCELAPLPDQNPAGMMEQPVLPAKAPSAAPPSNGAQADTLLDRVRHLVARRAELPLSAIGNESRMLSDLHLNSITVGQLVTEAIHALDLPPLVGVTEFANATVAQIAEALEHHARARRDGSASTRAQHPAGVDSWVRLFTLELIPTSLPRRGTLAPGQWEVIAPPDHPLAPSLRSLLAAAGGGGVIVCLPDRPRSHHLSSDASVTEDESVNLLLAGARRALARPSAARFVLVQDGFQASGFARSFHLETPEMTTCVVTVPFDHPESSLWVRDEVLAASGFTEAHYDDNGNRFESYLRLVPGGKPAAYGSGSDLKPERGCSLRGGSLLAPAGEVVLDGEDVLLVTGGGKGIAAECALALARRTGVRLVLMGRSIPEDDPELAGNLRRIEAAGVCCRYYSADVTDPDAVARMVTVAQGELGPITAVLHGAGANAPQLIGSLDQAAFERTLRPKTQGFRNIMAALDAEGLRLVITFGSIIARTGLPGEADYAVANGWLAELTEEFQEQHPHCRCLALEWSIWSGVGMGQRLGRVESLMEQGIMPISPEIGVDMLQRVLRTELPSPSVVISGRFGDPPTLKQVKPELPLLRFLENSRVFYPGVELVVEAQISPQTDPYLEDHILHRERLFPAVMGLEAMAQVAMALTGSAVPPGFEEVRLTRPVVLPERGRTTIRVAALVREPGLIEVSLRSEETGFQLDHFRALCRFAPRDNAGRWEDAPDPPLQRGAEEPLETQSSEARILADLAPPKAVPELYSDLLFHGGRFQRVRGYRLLRAKECWVEIEPAPEAVWFGPYLPQDRVLGDPGVRDAAIHAIQACIPQARVLPVGVRRITIGKLPCLQEHVGKARLRPSFLLHAVERSHQGNRFDYDVKLLAEDGTVLEDWEGLSLVQVEELPTDRAWSEALFGPFLERRLAELIPGASVGALLEEVRDTERTNWGARALRELIGKEVEIHHRADGKPELSSGHFISFAYAGELGLAVLSPGLVSCDLAEVSARSPEVWVGMLGPEGVALADFLSGRALAGDPDEAATIVWTVLECLKKAGVAWGSPLVFEAAFPDGLMLFKAGLWAVASVKLQVHSRDNPLAISVLCQPDTTSELPRSQPFSGTGFEPEVYAPPRTVGSAMGRGLG